MITSQLRMTNLLLFIFLGTVLSERIRRDTNSYKIEQLERMIQLVSRQLMMQQHHMEESVRSSGNSGLKRMRTNGQGTYSYYSASHSDANTISAMHDHPNYKNVLGLGEIIAVLNGVEFRTRHNDYPMKMRHPSQRGQFVDVPFPDVPPAVRQQTSLYAKISEMKEWFKAWKYQDYSRRDYRQFFKPVLCYLEGTWTLSDAESIEESFESPRNHLDAFSWQNLADKIRFTSSSGAMFEGQNLAYLPSTVIYLDELKRPVIAQWNYKVLCHPLSEDLPLNRLREVDDLKTRMAMGAVNMDQYKKSRAARFQLATFDKDTWQDGKSKFSLLDKLMAKIPGRDGMSGVIHDETFKEVVFPYTDMSTNSPLNVARYHRWSRAKLSDAAGRRSRHKGFSDVNMFVAQTTDPKVAGLTMEHCFRKNQCSKWSQKWSYAIPLEIVYMTPLSKWNPYNINIRGDENSTDGRQVCQGGRNGGPTMYTAYDGVSDQNYFLTPEQFFDDHYQDFDYYDESIRDVVHVIDSGGSIRRVRNSGFWINMPRIPGVGKLRQRYPIMPLHEDGSGVSKELEALKDVVLNASKYRHMFY